MSKKTMSKKANQRVTKQTTTRANDAAAARKVFNPASSATPPSSETVSVAPSSAEGAGSVAAPPGLPTENNPHAAGDAVAARRELLERLRLGRASPEMVKCRFCPTIIPKPEGTVYECDEHKNATGTFENPFVRE